MSDNTKKEPTKEDPEPAMDTSSGSGGLSDAKGMDEELMPEPLRRQEPWRSGPQTVGAIAVGGPPTSFGRRQQTTDASPTPPETSSESHIGTSSGASLTLVEDGCVANSP